VDHCFKWQHTPTSSVGSAIALQFRITRYDRLCAISSKLCTRSCGAKSTEVMPHTPQPQLPIQWSMKVLFSKHYTQLSSNAPKKKKKKKETKKRCIATSSPVSWMLGPSEVGLTICFQALLSFWSREVMKSERGTRGSYMCISLRFAVHAMSQNINLPPPAQFFLVASFKT
jgi:hypothetical protein